MKQKENPKNEILGGPSLTEIMYVWVQATGAGA